MAPIEIFCSVAPKDRTSLDRIATHLAPAAVAGRAQDSPLFTLWDSSQILPGTEKRAVRDKHLQTAQIILLLISPDLFLLYNEEEIEPAMQRYNKGQACVIPVLVRPVVAWKGTEPGQLRSVPFNGKPISLWRDRENAFYRVVEDLIPLIEKVAREVEQNIPHLDFHAEASQPGVGQNSTNQAALGSSARLSSEQGQAERFILTRYKPRLKQFQIHALRHLHRWHWLQWTTIIAAILTFLAVLANFLFSLSKNTSALTYFVPFLSFALSLILLACLGLFVTSPAYGKWIKYNQRASELRKEYRMYEDRADIYLWPDERERFFQERVNKIIARAEAGTEFLSDVEKYL